MIYRITNKLADFWIGVVSAPSNFGPQDWDYFQRRKKELGIEQTCCPTTLSHYDRLWRDQYLQEHDAFLTACGSFAEVFRRSYDAQYLLHALAYGSPLTQEVAAEIVYRWDVAEHRATASRRQQSPIQSECRDELQRFLGTPDLWRKPPYSVVTEDQWATLAISDLSFGRTAALAKQSADAAGGNYNQVWSDAVLADQLEQTEIIRSLISIETVVLADQGVLPSLSASAHKELLELQKKYNIAARGRGEMTHYEGYRLDELFTRYNRWADTHYANLPREHREIAHWAPITPEENEELLELEYKHALAREAGTALPANELFRLHRLIGRCMVMRTGATLDPEHN